MVSHHLVMIFSAGFSVKDEDLMDVEGGLAEVVELERGTEGHVRVSNPKVVALEKPVIQTQIDVLSGESR